MATIKFNDYIIEKSVYYANPSFKTPNDDDKLIINDEFNAEVGISDGEGFVVINVFLGNLEDQEKITNIPFSLDVSIRGIFEYDLDENEPQDDLKKILGSNALAILYPYLRAHISLVTSQSNQFPAYILPVANFVQMMDEGDKVTFHNFSE